jgi:leucyl-tRNA synthetase
MWTKFLYDIGLIGHDEPYKRLVNQGMIQGSSRFVYKWSWHLKDESGIFADIENFPLIFISDELMKKSIAKDNQFDTEISKTIINILNNLKIEGSIFLEPFFFNPIHIEVNIVDGYSLNIDEFRIKTRERKNSYFICDNLEIIYPGENGKEKGLIYKCGSETEKMSKSKYNTVNPDELCDKYGADTFRMYEMFLGPVEASKPWDTKGIEGVHRFLRKLWRLFKDEVKGPIWTSSTPSPLERGGSEVTDAELKILHRTIKKIEEDTEKFSFNTAVSAFMICVNDLADIKCHKKEVLEKILILLLPYAPHIAEELWHQLGHENTILDATFPAYDPALLVESNKEYPVSINGKVRTNLSLSLALDQAQVEEIILQNEIVQKWLDGNPPKKIIYVKNKMINVVV